MPSDIGEYMGVELSLQPYLPVFGPRALLTLYATVANTSAPSALLEGMFVSRLAAEVAFPSVWDDKGSMWWDTCVSSGRHDGIVGAKAQLPCTKEKYASKVWRD